MLWCLKGLVYILAVETLTFLVADIEGSTLLLRSVRDARYGELLAEHHRIIRTALALLNVTFCGDPLEMSHG